MRCIQCSLVIIIIIIIINMNDSSTSDSCQTGDGDAASGSTKVILRLTRVFTDIGDITAIDPQNADVIAFCRLPTVCAIRQYNSGAVPRT